MHLADLKSYLEADQRLTALHTDRDAWTRKAILNVAGSGKFSSDHTIAQYATEIWQAKPCPVALSGSAHLASCREAGARDAGTGITGLAVTQTATLA